MRETELHLFGPADAKFRIPLVYRQISTAPARASNENDPHGPDTSGWPGMCSIPDDTGHPASRRTRLETRPYARGHPSPTRASSPAARANRSNAVYRPAWLREWPGTDAAGRHCLPAAIQPAWSPLALPVCLRLVPVPL